ncbi:hypothetical protein MD484_g7142, partial [Candolleomyces efflorescens]
MNSFNQDSGSEALPEDISRVVFELAAEAGDGASCARVSKKVRSWVEPILYRRIIMSNPTGTRLLWRTCLDPRSSKSIQYLAKHARVAVVDSVDGGVESMAILKACSNLESLAIWSSFFFLQLKEKAEEFFATPFPSLRRLSLTDMIPKHQHFSFAIFSNLTHLDVVHDQGAQWLVWRWDALATLKHLTHLSVEFRSTSSAAPPELVREIITSSPPSLQIFVFWPCYNVTFDEILDSEEVKALCDGEVDARAVVASLFPFSTEKFKHPVIVHSGSSLLDDWSGKSVGENVWIQAERIVRERRRS